MRIPSFYLLWLLAVWSENSFAQHSLIQPANSYSGLNVYSQKMTDAFSFCSNQAALAPIKKISAGVYSERKFFLAELNMLQAALTFPFFNAGAGLKLAYGGSPLYNETEIGLAYARRLGSQFDLGIQFNYNAVSMQGYGKATGLSVEIGTLLHLSNQFNAGIHIIHGMGSEKEGKQLLGMPSVYVFGLGYDVSEKVFIGMEIKKEEGQPLIVNTGFQYRLIKQLLAGAGISSGNSSGWVGIGFITKRFRLDIITSFHQQLGLTPGLMLSVVNDKKEE